MKDCWRHDWTEWGELLERGWQAYGENKQTFLAIYQRRSCLKCKMIEERQIN